MILFAANWNTTIKITSKVDLNTLPAQLEYGMTMNYDFPSVLISVKAQWEPEVVYSSTHSGDGSDSGRADVTTISNPKGTPIVKIAHGYSGPVRCRVVRTFLSQAPTLGDVPVPMVIRPVYGTAFIRGVKVEEQGGDGGDYAHSLYASTAEYTPVQFGPVLTGSYILENSSFATWPVSVSASVDTESFGLISVSRSVSSEGRLFVDIPLSNPGILEPGTEVLIAAPVKKWRFGIYVQELIYARVPALL